MYLSTDQKWAAIIKKVEEGIKFVFPIEGKTGKIELVGLDVPKTDNASLEDQKGALLRNTSVTMPVYGDFRLTRNNKTETAKIKILSLPILTERGTFIVQGKDYSVFNQVRLKPGTYVRHTTGSDNVFADFNLGKGLGFEVDMDEAGVFYVRFDKSRLSTSSKKVPLYSLLRILGCTEAAMKDAWGEEVYKINQNKANLPDDTKQILETTVYSGNRTGNDEKDIKDYFNGTLLDKDTTKATLGQSFSKVTPEALLLSTQKMVKVYKGDENEDDLNSLLFKEVLSVEDHLMLRIEKKSRQDGLINKIAAKIDAGLPLRKCILSNLFTKLIEGFFTTSSLSAPQSEINPIEILETNHKITSMGEGGIASDRAVPMSARNLHPSHLGFLDPVRTTESTRVGIDLRTTGPTIVKDRKLYTKFLDKNGKEVSLTPQDTIGKTIGFSNQDGKAIVRAMCNGEMKDVPRKVVDYWMPKSSNMFTVTTNLVPFLQNDQGNRITMAGRMVTQAVPLLHREAPLVQIKDQSGEYRSIQEKYGKDYFVPKSPIDGTVKEVADDHITINSTKIELYHNFPLNLKTFITMYPLVKVGDKVKKGTILADSNFTKNGDLALGTNMHVAYMPYKGYTHEDAVVISDSAATKFTSQHMYVKEFEKQPNSFLDKSSFIKWFPTKISMSSIQKLDNDGVVKKDSVVERGDILITALTRKTETSADAMLKKLRGGLVNPYRDSSVVWDHDTPGKVIDVIKSSKLIRVAVTTEDKAKPGDKISGLHGNKSTIGLILPDDEMPIDQDHKRIDIMLNPASVISRVNPGQLYETLEGKLAKKTGKTEIIDNFDSRDSSKRVVKELKQSGVSVADDLYDPVTKKRLGKVLTGDSYFLKLHKQTEGNFSARYRGASDINRQPVKGGEEGSKAVGLLDVYALLGHNARNNLAEMSTYKSDKNDDFWNKLEAGITPAPAKEPFVFNKFKSIVTASGIGIAEKNDDLTLAPLNDRSIKAMSKGVISKGAILENHMGKDKPEKGGIFDPKVTGGMEGGNWSHMELAAPIVNPLFEGVVSILLHKNVATMDGETVWKELKKIKVDKRLGEINAAMKVAKGSARNKLIKELKYLTALKSSGMKPEDYVLHTFPIIPPKFRPVYDSKSGGLPMVSDVNYLYKDMLNVNEKLRSEKNFPKKEKGALLKDLRQSAQALVGLMAPINKQNEKRGVTGFLPQLTGSNYNGKGTSKESFFHHKVLKRPQNLTGRGTILPNPNLGIDNMEIPDDMAWKIYQPFVTAAFVKRGVDIIKARKEIQDKTPTAVKLLNEEMSKRPVLLNRAPTLHKFNIMAFKPKPVAGKSIYIPPLILKGFAADFDGDSVSGDTWVLVRGLDKRVRLQKIKDV